MLQSMISGDSPLCFLPFPIIASSVFNSRKYKTVFPSFPGLTHHVVRTLGSLMSCVEEGTRARKTASTLQNPSSSRSHALLTIVVAEGAGSEASSKRPSRGGSKLRLVDLAGSESAATCGGVHRLKVIP